jgi:hypothetical protein
VGVDIPDVLTGDSLGKYKKKTLRTIVNHIEEVMKDNHKADTPLEWAQIEET